jgi:hypothetical protein
MAATVTLLSMRTDVAVRGGYENSADITSAVLNTFINEAVKQVWDILKSKRDDMLVTSATLNTAIGVDATTLPATFYQLRKLEIADSSAPSGWRRLRQTSLDVSHQYAQLFGKRYRYRLQGPSVVLHPTPQAIETLRIYFIPTAPQLAADGDTFDGVNGYEDLVFQLALYRCRDRQEQDLSSCTREIARLTAQISSASDGRDVEPYYLNPYGASGSIGSSDDEDFWGY